ncbi:hypothetical protein C7M52_02480 [Mixta theicola]|nr:DUF1868 domain-containing protein [Mixta theicola]QHM76504.1 hypothetical protein C7M52_02480 [Mixta theicola]
MNNALPNGVNIKFDLNGNALPFYGNTVIGYVDNKILYEALKSVTNQIADDISLKKKLVLLPEESYHITIFDCVCIRDDGSWYWPSDLSKEATLKQCTDVLKKRFSEFKQKSMPDINFRITGHKPYMNTLAITFKPDSEADAYNINVLRNQLSELSGIRRDNHNEYEFHITLGYFIAYPDPGERKLMDRVIGNFMKQTREIDRKIVMKRVEFCTFNNMLEYQPVLSIK